MARKKIGIIWDSEVAWDDTAPFQIKNLDEDYAVYTELGWEEDLEFYIAHYEWYDEGRLTRAWHWNGEEWEKVEKEVELDGVFDKFKYDDETVPIKQEISERMPILNEPELEKICKDKLLTYNLFPKYVPETREATEENARSMFEKYGRFVLKPRYGAAGKGVEVVEDWEQFEEPEDIDGWIVQRFVETEGIPELGVEGPHDMRTHIINGVLQEGNYVRVPEEGLISNIARGGNQMYIDNDQIPGAAKEIIDEIIEEFDRFEPNLFAVDFMFDDNGKPWLVELNSKPGMYYHYPVKKKEYELPRMKALVRTLHQLVYGV